MWGNRIGIKNDCPALGGKEWNKTLQFWTFLKRIEIQKNSQKDDYRIIEADLNIRRLEY